MTDAEHFMEEIYREEVRQYKELYPEIPGEKLMEIVRYAHYYINTHFHEGDSEKFKHMIIKDKCDRYMKKINRLKNKAAQQKIKPGIRNIAEA